MSVPPESALLERALYHALTYLGRLDEAPVAPVVSAEVLRARFDRTLPDRGLEPERILDDLVAAADGGLTGSPSGRFFGWVIGGTLPSAVAADWMTTVWDQTPGLHAVAPAAAMAEEVAGTWLKDLLGLPGDASFALVTGCQMAHATCLAAARHALLERRGWDVVEHGLSGAPRIRIVTSCEMHGSVTRAVRLLGLGSGSIERLPSAADARLEPDVLRAALASAPDRPTIVILQAGDIHTGAFDPFEELIAIAHEAGAWVHVDGAFGLWAAASPAFRHLMQGASAADSWATDGHKWLNVPYDCGYAFVAHPDPHRRAMTYRQDYLTHSDDVRDPMDWNPEFSRRARGFATWAALLELGREGVADLVDRCCRHAEALVSGIGALPGAEIVSPAQLNQGLLRFPSSNVGATEADHDARTDAVMAAVAATGEAMFTGSTWRGRRVMRVSVSNWRTSERDVSRAVAAFERVLGAG